MAWARTMSWYSGRVENRLLIPGQALSEIITFYTPRDMPSLPLYRMVSKLRPCKFGSRNVFFEKSHVPSPTTILSELYLTAPGADISSGAGAMTATTGRIAMFQSARGGVNDGS